VYRDEIKGRREQERTKESKRSNSCVRLESSRYSRRKRGDVRLAIDNGSGGGERELGNKSPSLALLPLPPHYARLWPPSPPALKIKA
jgi:hypothetical protein